MSIRWAIIAGIALSTPWFVYQSKPASAGHAENSLTPRFRIGEVLNYRIDWQGHMGAGIAQLQVLDRESIFGAQAWHFRASLHTAEPIRAVYPMDDQIDSYAQLVDLESRRYQERFREFGVRDETDATFVSPGENSNAPAPHVIVPAGTRDALSAIYLLRITDWRKSPELRVPVFDGQNVYQMLAKYAATAEIRVTTGSYKATEIEISLFDGNRQVPDEHFKIWLAEDTVRTPLLCEAYLSIGTLRIELTSDSAFEVQANGDAITRRARSNPRAGN